MSPVAEAADTLPVTTATRIDVLDVLRGVVIFGFITYRRRLARLR